MPDSLKPCQFCGIMIPSGRLVEEERVKLLAELKAELEKDLN